MLSLQARVRLAAIVAKKPPSAWAEVGIEPPADPRTGLPITLTTDGKRLRIVPRMDGLRTEDDLALDVN